MRRLAALEERSVTVFVHTGIQVKARARDTGIYRVYSHAFRSKLQRGASRQLVDRRLTYAVGQNIGKRTEAGHTGNDYDIAFAFNNGRQCELSQLKYGSNVDVHHYVVVGKCRIFNGAVCDDARGIYEDIDSSQVAENAFDECHRLPLV